MQMLLRIVSLVALGLVLVPSMMYFGGMVALAIVTRLALIGTLIWFVATPMWMGRELPVDATHVEI
ncbi:MAG: hypothetical protein KatS3mg111_2421 [Pirellulaceae bacterium]|nr:MAG: hypothetical protein KatS3mg111_2421 [Pirellulaceae bacterium]